jgi:hypothetical protein
LALAGAGLAALAGSEVWPAEPDSLPPEAVAWVRDTAIPIRSVAAGSGFDDLRPLAKLIGEARIVALGEPTHGTREAFQMKHRLLEFLVSELGFSIFSIEASMPEAYRIDDYVLRGDGDPGALIGGMHFWTWNTQEVLAMVEWMRRFNAGAGGKSPVHFTGFDMQSLEAAAANVRGFVRRAKPEASALLDTAQARWKAAMSAGAPAFGVATATFPVDVARGKRVRYSGSIRTQDVDGWAGLWWRVDGPKGVLAFDNMQGRGARGTTDWKRYEIQLPVDSLATNINFGVLMPGKEGVVRRPPCRAGWRRPRSRAWARSRLRVREDRRLLPPEVRRPLPGRTEPREIRRRPVPPDRAPRRRARNRGGTGRAQGRSGVRLEPRVARFQRLAGTRRRRLGRARRRLDP